MSTPRLQPIIPCRARYPTEPFSGHTLFDPAKSDQGSSTKVANDLTDF